MQQSQLTPEEMVQLIGGGVATDGTQTFFYDCEAIAAVDSVNLLHSMPEGLRGDFEEGYVDGAWMKVIVTSPHLTVMKYFAPAGSKVPPHHHGVHQMTYVLKGELHYGTEVAKPGMGLFTPGKRYSWKAGPEGVEFLDIFGGIPSGTF